MSEQYPYFPSGEWEGFYNDFRRSRTQGTMAMILEFSDGAISGGGSDPIGAYTWMGYI